MADVRKNLAAYDVTVSDNEPGSGIEGLAVRPATRLLSTWGTGLPTDTTGDKLTYTATRKAKVLFASWFNVSGTPTVALALKSGATYVTLGQFTSNPILNNPGIVLQPGESLVWRVTIAGAAGSTAQAYIAVEEVA